MRDDDNFQGNPFAPASDWKIPTGVQQSRDRERLAILEQEFQDNPNDVALQREITAERRKQGGSVPAIDADNFKGNPFAEQSAQQPTNTVGQEALRQLGLTGRALVSAAASPVTLAGDVIGKGINALTGNETIKPYSRVLQRTLTSMGLPEPQRPIEQFTQGMSEAAPAFALPATLPTQVLGNAAIASAQARPGEELSGAAWGAGGGALGQALAPVARGAGHVLAHTLGMTTGAGDEAIRQAFKGGPGFVENMRGKVEPAVVVEQARAGIQQMRQNMAEAYRNSKPLWAMGQRLLDMTPVIDEYMKLIGSQSHQGFSKMGPAEQRVIQEIDDVLLHFRDNPALHTTEGFDALKQRLQAIYPESPQMRQAQRAVSTMANAVRQTIIDQNPSYAQAMQAYHGAASQLDEIERTLSLGDRATIDTALRKLQSLVRNNVNTNFGQRVSNANVLAQQGGADVMPAVAGQALNSWTPRGITRAIAGGAGGFGALSGALTLPQVIAGAAAGSPRIVGEVARGVGIPFRNEYAQAAARALRRGVAPAAVELGNE